MTTKTVEFRYVTGLKRRIFYNARLRGSWNDDGRYADLWSESSMQEAIGEDGCPSFAATIELDLSDSDKTFSWGVLLDGPQGANFWGVPTEVKDMHTADRYRQFRLDPSQQPQVETYYFTLGRRLGANKYFSPGNPVPGIRFSVWAPNAQHVDVVFGLQDRGYIDDDGSGIDESEEPIALTRQLDGVWDSDPLPGFDAYVGLPYMYRIQNEQGQTVYRTDIFSRLQIGSGSIDPKRAAWPGTPETLDGTKSCSVVVDPDAIAQNFETPSGEETLMIPAEAFWSNEFTPGLTIPSRVEDLVIYELHVGALGFGKAGQGTLRDAIPFLDHLVSLGVNAVELLPMSEFSEKISWGYGDTHHFCIETSAGGRDQYRHFIRECHRRGIAVIQDVVYNHYDLSAERAQWQYDSISPDKNIYYWYEGRPSDYANPDGGYLNNGSSGYSPRFWEEVVRHQFISSAAFFVEEMHVDGFRADLTQAIHRDNTLNADGRSVGSANIFGQKLLREWSRTLHMIRPTTVLIAEDHSEWPAVTESPAAGGLGFDATWYAKFCHNLIGDSDMASSDARLVKQAGYGGDEPLSVEQFAGVLYSSRYNKVVYHKNHDECGNAPGTARTVVTAVNHAPLVGAAREYAEARSRVAFGLSILSAGTPLFFMAEEIAAQKDYCYDNVLASREDILGDRAGQGASMFRFYQDIITLCRRLRPVRSQNIDILHCSNPTRVIVFKRWSGREQILIFASLNNFPFENGYVVTKDLLGNGSWKELFNSDAAIYGGRGVENAGANISSYGGRIEVRIPANGFIILTREV